MNFIEQIHAETRHLPVEAQAEVLDFVRFLRAKFPVRPLQEQDEVSRLLRDPLRVEQARPLSRDDLYAR